MATEAFMLITGAITGALFVLVLIFLWPWNVAKRDKERKSRH